MSIPIVLPRYVFEKGYPTTFDKECMKFHGRILTGKYTHCCPEWDYMPIDESCNEFECCSCFKIDK